MVSWGFYSGPAPKEFQSRPREINELTSERCPVPLYALEERALGGAHHELAVGRQQGPGLYAQLPVPAQRGEPGHELVPVGVILEDLGSLDTPAHDVV